jgi:predicted nucleic acid-binding protein
MPQRLTPTSRTVFVDTSAWYALADAGDAHHVRAARTIRNLLDQRRRLLTTNFVAGETYTLLRVRLGWRVAQDFLRRTRNSSLTERIPVQEPWEVAAEQLLSQYEDHDLSYVDATSFVAMRQLGLPAAFAFDHHFATLGFRLVGTDG